MGLQDLKIIFDNPWNTYYPGQTISGRILVVLDGPKKIRGINIKIKGEANTCWSIDNQVLNNEGRYENENQTVTGYEEYFKTQFYALGSASGSEIELKPGEHTYPFSFVLPPNLPSSFESDFGHIRYTVKAILDRPWKFDQEVKAAFTVVSPLDLNQEPRASEPIQQEMSKTFCCLCCATGPLTVDVSAPVRGYVPGQSIPIKVNVENRSGVIVDNVKLILRKLVRFHANTQGRSEVKEESMVVTEVSRGPIEGDQNLSYEQTLDIPPLPPSNLANCSIIDLEYNLKIEACVNGWFYRNLHGDTLIFVGTVPLANYQNLVSAPVKAPGGYPEPNEMPSPDKSSEFAPSAPQLPPTSNLYPNLPPPSYEESAFGARSLRDRDESENMLGWRNPYAPRYPVYNFAAQQ